MHVSYHFVICFAALLLSHHVQPAVGLLGVPSEVDQSFEYDVVFSQKALTAEDVVSIPPERLYPMRQSNGSSFLCVLPPSEEEMIADNMHNFHVKVARGERVAPYQPGDIVPSHISSHIEKSIAAGGDIMWKHQYWHYNLSVGKFIQQHHASFVEGNIALGVNPLVIDELYVLGVEEHEWARTQMADSEDPRIVALRSGETVYTFQRDHEGSYLSSVYAKGDACEVTGGLRHTEVQLRCLVDADTNTMTKTEIEEVGTCAYVLKLYDERACVPGLLGPWRRRLKIMCHRVAAEPTDGTVLIEEDL